MRCAPHFSALGQRWEEELDRPCIADFRLWDFWPSSAEAVWKLLADALAPGAQGICAATDEPRNRVNQAAIARVMPCTPMILIIRFML